MPLEGVLHKGMVRTTDARIGREDPARVPHKDGLHAEHGQPHLGV
jgi:hypothetical protein